MLDDEEDDVIDALVVQEQPAPLVRRDPLEGFTHPVWEQQPEEPKRSFAQFLHYATLPKGTRTIEGAWRKWHGEASSGRSGAYFRNSTKWQWKARAELWDIFKEQQIHDRWMIRDVDRRERDYEVGGKLRDKAERALENLEDEASPMEITTMLQTASKLQEAAVPDMDLPADQIQQVLGAMDPEKREIVIKALMVKITK